MATLDHSNAAATSRFRDAATEPPGAKFALILIAILFLAFFLVICNAVSDILQRIFQRGHAEGAVQ